MNYRFCKIYFTQSEKSFSKKEFSIDANLWMIFISRLEKNMLSRKKTVVRSCDYQSVRFVRSYWKPDSVVV